MREKLEEKFGPCGKALFYFKSEFNYEPQELIQMYETELYEFFGKLQEKSLLNPTSSISETYMREAIDNFMIDVNSALKRKNLLTKKIY